MCQILILTLMRRACLAPFAAGAGSYQPVSRWMLSSVRRKGKNGMGRRLAVTIAAVLAVGVLGAPANATHEGTPGLRLAIEGECFYLGPAPYFNAVLGAEVRAYESRDDVTAIRVRYMVQYRSPGQAVWTTFQDWTNQKLTANGERVRYDEGATVVVESGKPGQDLTDYRVVVTVTWAGPTARYTHRFVAAQTIDGVCSEKTYPTA